MKWRPRALKVDSIHFELIKPLRLDVNETTIKLGGGNYRITGFDVEEGHLILEEMSK